MASGSRQSKQAFIGESILQTLFLGPIVGGCMAVEQLCCEAWFGPIFGSILNHMLARFSLPLIGAGLTATSVVVWGTIALVSLRLMSEVWMRMSGLSESLKDSVQLYTSFAYLVGVHLTYYGLQDLGFSLSNAMIASGVMTSVCFMAYKAYKLFSFKTYGYVPPHYDANQPTLDPEQKFSLKHDLDRKHTQDVVQQASIQSDESLSPVVVGQASPPILHAQQIQQENAGGLRKFLSPDELIAFEEEVDKPARGLN